jgi:aminopeptidase
MPLEFESTKTRAEDIFVGLVTSEYPSRQLLGKTLGDAIERLERISPGPHLREQMEAVYQVRNLIRLAVSEIEVDGERLLRFADDGLQEVENLKVAPELVKGLARTMFKASKAKKGDTVMICGTKQNFQVLEEIAEICLEEDVNFKIDVDNPLLKAEIVNNMESNGIKNLAEEWMAYVAGITKIDIRSNPDPSIKFDPERTKMYGKATKPQMDRYRGGKDHFTITMIPTPEDAKLDGMEYEPYLQFYFEALDQPWEEIAKAQEKLKAKLDAGKKIHIKDGNGTNITFDIEGFTFASSVLDKNVPGSELFSAPKKDSAEGKIVAKGKFRYRDFEMMEDLVLTFEKGKIVSATARVGQKTLDEILSQDEGMQYIGELAFGTNPHIRRHLINALLVEKINGSFHIALGNSHDMKDYEGEQVNIDNRNRSANNGHWDIATLLRGMNSKIYLDGKLLQKNGIWVTEFGHEDKELAVLNHGWAALPEEVRPDWFKAS